MLYLSRLIIDTRSSAARRDLADCHQLHRRILGAFPQAPEGASAREHFGLLYRAEPFERDPRLVRVLVQSATMPDWSRLPAGYLAPPPDERGNPAVRPIGGEYAQIHAGMRLIFRLRANPTRRIGADNAEQGERWRGKRVELRREEDQLAWLARKGEAGGFRLVGVEVRPEVPDARATTLEKVRGRRPSGGSADTMPLRFGAVLFEGRLEVTDRAAFLDTLRVGIGSGKAFGFGLLSVASAS
ncbi:MAG TPA: type I-E CRISPR-associated protein Cas6/Cse3/CasE [Roseiflexaceae bacterium]|nr:type I-E CRISPR-associated protein Cas6/Cse3/CasE [Roseiflexaceae bacterium]